MITHEYSVDYWLMMGAQAPKEPSSFASICLPYLKKGDKLLDICCGNGRDSVYFKNQGLDVYSFDINGIDEPVTFKAVNLLDRRLNFTYGYLQFNAVYCRFVLHAIPEELEDYVLVNANNVLLKDGLLFIEVRSDKGVISNKINTHYRRLINREVLKQKLENLNFSCLSVEEKQGLSIHNNEDPVLIRIVAKKINRVCIQTNTTHEEVVRRRKPGDSLNPNDCRYLLLTVKRILEENNIQFFLIFGTLLGAYRDKRFIDHDDDIDIGLFSRDRGRFLQLMEQGVFAVYGMKYRSNESVLFNTLEYKSEYIDFFFYKKQGHTYRCGKATINAYQLDKGFSKIRFLGTEFNTVWNIEEYLIHHYGDKWKVPRKNYHAKF